MIFLQLRALSLQLMAVKLLILKVENEKSIQSLPEFFINIFERVILENPHQEHRRKSQ